MHGTPGGYVKGRAYRVEWLSRLVPCVAGELRETFEKARRWSWQVLSPSAMIFHNDPSRHALITQSDIPPSRRGSVSTGTLDKSPETKTSLGLELELTDLEIQASLYYVVRPLAPIIPRRIEMCDSLGGNLPTAPVSLVHGI